MPDGWWTRQVDLAWVASDDHCGCPGPGRVSTILICATTCSVCLIGRSRNDTFLRLRPRMKASGRDFDLRASHAALHLCFLAP